jgi:hypothetical protein
MDVGEDRRRVGAQREHAHLPSRSCSKPPQTPTVDRRPATLDGVVDANDWRRRGQEKHLRGARLTWWRPARRRALGLQAVLRGLPRGVRMGARVFRFGGVALRSTRAAPASDTGRLRPRRCRETPRSIGPPPPAELPWCPASGEDAPRPSPKRRASLRRWCGFSAGSSRRCAWRAGA